MNKEELIQFFRANEIWAKKTMGQNFLVDEEVLAKIIQAADIKSSDTILEIGPGLGVLTEELSRRAEKVIAIEKDDKLAEMLKSKFSGTNVEILNKNALEFDPSNLGKYKLVANIPYNITSLITRKFLETKNKPELIILMVQKEVAERITAKPGDVSVLSVSVQFYAEAEIVDMVSAESFFPVPKVDSAIIRITPKRSEIKMDGKQVLRIVKFGFAARRKTLENNLSAGLHIEKSVAADIIRKTGLGSKIRAEDLSVANWLSLHKVIEEGNGGEGTRRGPQKG